MSGLLNFPMTLWDNPFTRFPFKAAMQIYFPMTLWDNPFTRVPFKAAVQISGVVNPIIPDAVREFFRTNPIAYAFAASVRIPVGVVTRFTYGMGHRFFHTVTVLDSLSDIDALGKASPFASGLAASALGKDHPLVQLIDLGKEGIEGLVFVRHIPSLYKLDFMKVWKDDGSFNWGQTLKNGYPLLFQGAHLCAGLSYLQKCGFVEYAPIAARIGVKVPVLQSVIGQCMNFGLSKLKNRLVVAGAVTASLGVIEWLAHKAWTYRAQEIGNKRVPTFEGFLGTISDRDEDDQFGTLLNNVLKAYVVYASSIGNWSTKGSLFFAAANILGLTNLHRCGATVKKEYEKAAIAKSQLAAIYERGAERPTLQDGGQVVVLYPPTASNPDSLSDLANRLYVS